jgi:SPP1 family phage portal protein
MDGKEIKRYIDADRIRVTKNDERRHYFEGKNPGVYEEQARADPDNRIPIPFARKAVKIIRGYMAKPGSITYQGDYYDEYLKDIYNQNDEDLTTAELLESALIYGESFELQYMVDGELNFAQVPINQSIPIYDNSLKPTMTGFIRYYCEGEKKDAELMRGEEPNKYFTDTGKTQIAYYYDDKVIQKYKKAPTDKDFIPDGKAAPHGFGFVPVTRFTISSDGKNLYDHVLELIDWYDKIVSHSYADELEKFANSYLLLANAISQEPDANGETAADRIKRDKVFDNLAQNLERSVKDAVAYLERNVNDTFLNNTADRAERLIYEMLQVFNPRDIVNNTATSGIAAAYKLLETEYLCADIECYFSRGLQHRIKLISGIGKYLNKTTGEGDSDVYIKFIRNVPFNITEIADVAMKLKGVLSDETILKLFPTTIVNDWEEEMEKLYAMPDMERDVDKAEEDTSEDPLDPDAEAEEKAKRAIGA